MPIRAFHSFLPLSGRCPRSLASACERFRLSSPGAARVLWPVVAWISVAVLASLFGCSASTQPTRTAALGTPVSFARAEADLARPGPIRFERVSAADWAVARSGLINLDHPRARAAGLEDGLEPIEVFFYVLEHPKHGDYLVDSGIAQGFRAPGRHPDVSLAVESVLDTETLDIHVTTAEWLATRPRPVSGVFLTHLHLDHVMGLPDVPESVRVYVGPGEAEARGFLNLFSRGTIDRMLARDTPLEVWPFAGETRASGGVDVVDTTGVADVVDVVDVVDVFGDGSLFALHVPGHTAGSMAFLVRSTTGPRLLVGDSSHTRWGWENGVEPGTFTADAARNAESLAILRALAARHPEIEVHLGHQRLE